MLVAAERGLRAGVQTLLARQQHELVEEDAAVDPLAAAHALLDAEDHADRRIEKFIVLAELLHHAGGVAARHTEEGVELLADEFAARVVDRREFLGIDVVLAARPVVALVHRLEDRG
jgi:hypothetical protein